MSRMLAHLASAMEFLAVANETGRWALVRWGLAPAPKPVSFDGLLDELFARWPLDHDERQFDPLTAVPAWTTNEVRLAA